MIDVITGTCVGMILGIGLGTICCIAYDLLFSLWTENHEGLFFSSRDFK